MDLIEKKTEELIQAIKDSEYYHTYTESLKKVMVQPDVKKRLDDFRIQTFRMYAEVDASELFEETDRIEKMHQGLRNIPEVNEFLEAEIKLCRILKLVENRINEEIDIQIPDT